MIGTKFWLGRHPAPPGIIDLKIQHFDTVLEAVSVADLVVSVDTGPLHVAAAFGIPAVAINQSSSPELHLSDQCDYVMVTPPLDCVNCQVNVCPINSHIPPCQHVDPALISAWANAKLRPMTHDGVSAVVAVYQPEPGTLNHCLENLLPQVDEIIVTAEANSKVPPEALKHEKIKYVRKNVPGIGYGRNANYGVRHSTHKLLLLLNDDVFLDPQAVQRMREAFRPDTGLVANLLRYPEGTIYHAGKSRSPGVRAWGHIDYRQKDCTTKEPTEMENVCMACCMVRREAFYQINGFDEDFFIYSEDDDFCLRLRRAGWKIIFTPHSSGIHMEHQSTRKLTDIATAVAKANAIFDRKWHAYFDANLNRIPGGFDY
jgi:GT2 family glycosyltransferase